MYGINYQLVSSSFVMIVFKYGNASQLDHAPTRPLEDTNSTPACQLDHAPTLIAGSDGASLMCKHQSSNIQTNKKLRTWSELRGWGGHSAVVELVNWLGSSWLVVELTWYHNTVLIFTVNKLSASTLQCLFTAGVSWFRNISTSKLHEFINIYIQRSTYSTDIPSARQKCPLEWGVRCRVLGEKGLVLTLNAGTWLAVMFRPLWPTARVVCMRLWPTLYRV